VSDHLNKPLGLEEDLSGLDNISIDDPIAQLSALAEERDRLLMERADLNDRLLRRTAEFDNFRKRVDRERLEMSEYAGMETVKALLPILDDFDRATKQPCADAEYAKGIELIHHRIYEILKKTGLTAIEAAGQPFDPNLHQGIEMVATDEAEDQTILAEYQRGYLFKGKLLRPSMVKVAVRR
jgi:molecular chaperone GrpE